MNNKWENGGDDLQKIIDDAIKSGNYSNLGNDVDDIIDNIKNSATNGAKAFAGAAQDFFEGQTGHSYDFREKQNRYFEDLNKRALFKSDTSILAGALTRLILGGVNLFASFISVIAVLFSEGINSDMLIAEGFLIPWLIISTAITAKGSKHLRLRSLMNRIRTLGMNSGDKESVDLDMLTGGQIRTTERVRKDVNYMLTKDWFPQGHLDRSGNTLILSNRAYEMYTKALESYDDRQRLEEERRRAAAENISKEEELSPDVKKVIADGKAYMDKMQILNDRIPGVEISEKIDRIKGLTERILDRVAAHPDQVDQTKKLMRYYLPMMIKLLTAYADMEDQPDGENIRNSRKQIEGALDSLNDAFEKLLDDLYADTAFDVQSDVTVLENMLKQEGLKDQELKSDRH